MKLRRTPAWLAAASIAVLAGCDDGTSPRRPGAPAAIVVVSGNLQTAIVGTALPDPLIVQVTDSAGMPIPNQVINFRVAAGGGSVFAGAAQTNKDGIAQERWTIGTVAGDTQRVEVRIVDPTTGEPKVLGTFKAVGLPAAPASIRKASGDSVSTTVTTAVSPVPSVLVTDQYGNGVSGVGITFVIASGGGTLTGAAQTTNATGRATAGSWNVGSVAGVNTVVATADLPTPLSVTFTAMAVAGVAADLFIEQPASGARAGLAFEQQPRVRVRDAHGNPVSSSATVAMTVTSGATVIGSSAAAAVDGVVTFSNAGLSGTAGTHTLTYTATLSGEPRSVTQPITLTPGPSVGLVIQQPASASKAGEPFDVQPVIHVVDDSNNRTDDNGTIVIGFSSVGGTLIGTTAVTTAQGVAQFSDLAMDAPAGNYTLTFKATINGVYRTASQPLALASGTPTQYVVSAAPTTVQAGSATVISAQLADINGVPVPRAGQTVTWSRTGVGGTFSTATSTTNASGIASVSFTPDTMGSVLTATITATDAEGRTGATQVNVTAGPAVKLAFVTQPVNGGATTELPWIHVAVHDQFGNLRSSDARPVQIALGNNPAGATLSGTLQTTSINGVATFYDLVIDRAGSGYTLVASSAGLTAAESNPFDISEVSVLAVGARSPGPLRADSFVFYTGQPEPTPYYSVYRVLTKGGARTEVRDFFGGTSSSGWDLLTDGSELYFVAVKLQQWSITRVPFSGASATRIDYRGFGNSLPTNYVTDSTYIYFAVNTPDRTATALSFQPMYRIRMSDGAETQLLPAADRHRVAVHGGYVYYHEAVCTVWESDGCGTIRRVPATGGTPEVLVTSTGSVSDMVVANNTVYWFKRPEDNSDPREIFSAPANGGTATLRITGLAGEPRLATDGVFLFVQDNSGLRQYSLADFSMTLIPEVDGPFTFDDAFFYWISATGQLKKMPR